MGVNFEFFHLAAKYSTSVILGTISMSPGGLGVTEGSFAGLLALQGFEFQTVLVFGVTSVLCQTKKLSSKDMFRTHSESGLGGLRSLDLYLRRVPRYPCFASNDSAPQAQQKKTLLII